MKKRAYINIILIGAMLIVSVVVFVSTTADDVVWKNKYFNLKKITDSAALSLAGAYNLEHNQYEVDPFAMPESVANDILNNSNLGQDASNYITYTWCLKKEGCVPNDECVDLDLECSGDVTATITNYQHDNFWYKFMGKDQFTFEKIESTANILNNEIEGSSDFLPIAVNGCTQDYPIGTEFDFILGAHDIYNFNDNDSFFALSEPGGGQSSFAHFKNMITDILDGKDSEFDKDEIITISNVDWEDVENDVKQVSQSFDITTITATNMTILVVDCNSTATGLIKQEILPIVMTDVYCAPDETAVETAIDEYAADPTLDPHPVFNPVFWFKSVPSCNSTSYFRIHFEVTGRSNADDLVD